MSTTASWYQMLDLGRDVVADFQSLVERELSTCEHDVQECLLRASQIRQYQPLHLRTVVDQLIHGKIAALHIRGLIDVSSCGPTPSQLPQSHRIALAPSEAPLIALASILGHPFGWSSIQHGNIVNDVHAVEDHASLKRSSGFTTDFDFHTEDAFSPHQEHYLALLCVRNKEAQPTILSCIDELDLDDRFRESLQEDRFTFKANLAHDTDPVSNYIKEGAILYGDVNRPFLRVNFNQPMAQYDRDQQSALDHLRSKLAEKRLPVILQEGDVLLLDNLLVAHGRDSYVPEQPAVRRWLKRVYVTSNYRCLSTSLDRTNPYLARA